MSPRDFKRAGHGPSKMQRVAMLAARSGKLFESQRLLVMRQGAGKFLPVRLFGPKIIKDCEKAGWLQRMEQGDGWSRIMTTVAGDAALATPLRLVRPAGDDWQREALR